MILYEWIAFGTDTKTYTKTNFEEEIGDTFEAMFYDNDNQSYPRYIWTTHFIILTKSSSRIVKDVSFIKIPRNPATTKQITRNYAQHFTILGGLL